MSRDIAVIRHDIEQTRGRLRDTAEAIGWKADVPSRARDILRETAAVVRERVAAGSTAPAPSRSGDSGPSMTERIGNVASSVADRVGGTASAVGGAVGSAASAVGSGAEGVAGSVASAGAAVGDAASSTKEAIAHGASAATEGVAGARQSAAEHAPDPGTAREGARRVVRGARANPVAIAAGALALGAVAGLMLPSTRVEDQNLGSVADDVKERGAELAQEAIDRGREATQAVADADLVSAATNGDSGEAPEAGV